MREVRVCTDCEHEHGGVSHGFCQCGCTYLGVEIIFVDDEKNED